MNTELTQRRRHYRLLTTRDSTVGHWLFRGDLVDQSAQGNDLTVINLGAYDAGATEPIVTAVQTTGVVDEGAKIPAAQGGDFDFGTNSFTVEVIIQPQRGSGDFPVAKHNVSPDTGFILGVGAGGPNLLIQVGDGTNSGTLLSATVYDSTRLNRWEYWAFVVNRETDRVHMYINGTEDANSPLDITGYGSLSNAGEDLRVADQCLAILDEICISKEALAPADIAVRARGTLVPEVLVVPGELKGYARDIDQGLPGVDELLAPFEAPFAGVRERVMGIADLVRPDLVPERFLPSLANLFNFELPGPDLLDLAARRNMFKWISWLYQNKGTHACVDKLIELVEFSATTGDQTPTVVPLLLNVHRLAGWPPTKTTLFSDDFTDSLAKWDPPLNPLLPWRLQSGALYCNVGAGQNYDNAILFTDNARQFYIAVDVKMIAAVTSSFGFVLAYADSDNWLRLEKETAGGTYWILRWSYEGTTGVTLLGNAWSVWSDYSNGDTVKLWLHVDLDQQLYAGGVDGHMTMYNETYAHPDIVGSRKGLWLGDSAEVEFDNVLTKVVNRDLVTTLPDDTHRYGRRLQINYTGTSALDQRKKAYLAAVLPNYIPFGVTLEWIRVPTAASRFLMRTGTITVKHGWPLSGDKAAGFKMRTAGITAIRGSLVRTPTPSGFIMGTNIVGITRDPGAIQFRMRTGSLSKTSAVNIVQAGYDIDDTTPTEDYALIFDIDIPTQYPEDVIDGDQVTFARGLQPGNNGDLDAVAIECSSTVKVKYIHIYDAGHHAEVDGLWAGGGNDKLEVYYSNGSAWTLLEQFTSITRLNRKIELEITSPVAALYWKIRAYDAGCLRYPSGNRFAWAEIELMQITEVN